MAQNENISLSLGDRIDVLNKSQSLDARYGVYDSESEALLSMASYGLDGRIVAVYTDKVNGKVRLYKYNQVQEQLDPIDEEGLIADNISYDNTDSGLDATNVQDAIDEVSENASNITLEQARQNGNVFEGDVEIEFGSTFGNSESAISFNVGILEFKNALDYIFTDYYSNPDDFININLAYSGGIVASKEFNNQGKRKNFAQIADLEDALEDYIQEPSTDGTSGQVLTTDGSGGRSWTTVSGGGAEWDNISGDQSDVNISGFTNDSGFTTNTGTVESVALSAPTGFDISGSPVTTTGTLTFDYSSGYQAYTTAEANKLSGIETGAQVNVKADWNSSSGDSQILNKPTIPTKTSDLTNDSGFITINEIPVLTNDDNTLIIDEDIIRLNVTNVTEEFTANGTDRNFEMTNVYTSIENVFINGVRIKKSDYITISAQEIEIKTTVTLLSGDEVVIQGTMFIE